MPNDDSQAEAKLRKLGRHLDIACAKLPVLPPEQLDQVRKAVQEQWQQQQLANEKTDLAEGQSGTEQDKKKSTQEQQKAPTQSQQKPKSKARGHSH